MKLRWWQKRAVYQIYPRSFCDSNGDGIGDLRGVISRLDYLKQLGVGIIWLSPVYRSPNVDNGYDISDYFDINPELGTMADMDELIQEAGKRDLRIIMDLVINHTSDQHSWFQQSRDPQSPYRDYYYWRPGRNGRPPNNWTSFFAEDCWVYDERSNEYYLHLFAKEQPDLNYHNPQVLAEIEKILRFWLDKGISGFRCDVINIIYKDSLANGRKRLILTGLEHYLSRPGTHEILRRLRRNVFSCYDCFTVGETVFVTPKMGRDLCGPERRELDMIFSFEHMETDQIIVKWFKRKFQPGRLARALDRWQQVLEWNANYLENHDQPRSVSRFGDDGRYWLESAKLLATLLLTLRGTPFIFQGQEIGMTNFDFTSLDQVQDVESHNVYRLARRLRIPGRYRWRMIRTTSRDNARTPMQWDETTAAGFTTGTPWLGVNGNHRQINAARQREDENSVFRYYQRLIALRAENETLLDGNFKLLQAGRKIVVFSRQLREEKLIIALNFSGRPAKIKYRGQLLLASSGRTAADGVLLPWEAVILIPGSQGG